MIVMQTLTALILMAALTVLVQKAILETETTVKVSVVSSIKLKLYR